MSIRSIVSKQYREKVNQVALQLQGIALPPEGWLCTMRKALGMSAAQLARRLKKTRALISHTEKAELSGGVTLKTMQALAEGMSCRFVYAIVPEKSVQDILEIRAKEKAQKRVLESSKHMALEKQSLTKKQITFEVERLQQEMLKDMPSDFWNDES
jgi:predicted DNA-binding mobile mystery protein A